MASPNKTTRSPTIQFLICGITLLTISMSTPAALTVYTDRSSWLAAAGGSGDLFENFDSFISDSIYEAAPLAAGFLSFSVINGPSDSSWRIDAIPAAFPADIPNVNGTTFVSALSLDNHPANFGDTLMSFQEVGALGFDYSGAAFSNFDGSLTTNLGDSVVIPMSGNANKAFIGLLYTDGETFSSLEWGVSGGSGPGSHRFAAGIDNVEAFTSPVPLPAALWLFAPVTALLLRRRKTA